MPIAMQSISPAIPNKNHGASKFDPKPQIGNNIAAIRPPPINANHGASKFNPKPQIGNNVAAIRPPPINANHGASMLYPKPQIDNNVAAIRPPPINAKHEASIFDAKPRIGNNIAALRPPPIISLHNLLSQNALAIEESRKVIQHHTGNLGISQILQNQKKNDYKWTVKAKEGINLKEFTTKIVNSLLRSENIAICHSLCRLSNLSRVVVLFQENILQM